MATSPVRKAELAKRAWRLMFDFLIFTSPARQQSLQKRGLTPNDARALFSLDREDGRPIGTLASQWGCDPSNATFIIDRLEKVGLAERRASAADRRIKLVTLTRRGARTKTELMSEYHLPPPEMDRLSKADLEALEELLQKLRPSETRP